MTALMWAMVLAYSLYPVQRKFTGWFRGSRTLAACFVTLMMTIVLAGPIVLIGFSIAQDGKDLAQATRNWFMAAPEQAPPWVEKLPLVGTDMASYWTKFAEDRKPLMDQLDKEVKTVVPRPKIVVETEEGSSVKDAPPVPPADEDGKMADEEKKPKIPNFVVVLGKFLSWAWSGLLSVTWAVGHGLTQLVLSGFLAFFLLRDAPVLADRLAIAADRLAGTRGQHLITVAGGTVRGVIYGILGTAIVQALVAGLGFWIAGVPGAVLLSVLTFFFAVMPFGPPLIWIPAALWLFAQHKPGLGIFMLVWGTLVFPCVLSSVEYRYTLFKPDGSPLRAVAACSFCESVPDAERVRLENATSPDLTHLRDVRDGDTLPMLAYDIYGKPELYLEVARANNLVNFRRLRAASRVAFPPVKAGVKP